MHSELSNLRGSLKRYITSTYHISDPKLVRIRRQLLDADGAVAQRPYLESTARYDAADARRFAELDLSRSVRDFLTDLGSGPAPLVFDPPYKHQSRALELVCGGAPRDIVVTTGTGSGKTEAFLLPVLARLAREASEQPLRFRRRAVRALLLYPMNALVNDQLARLRLLFGDRRVCEWFTERSGGEGGRPAKFGRYTGRALYPGSRKDEPAKHSAKLRSLTFYQRLEGEVADGNEASARLVGELKRLGRWPAKPSVGGEVGGFTEWFGPPRRRWKDAEGRYQYTVERREDPELLLRQECQEAPPDLLITNYSMLEYMLLRPVERGIFRETQQYFEANPEERFILVLDEAHLYRGAQGTEVALLIRRLAHRLGLDPSRLQVICTSASFTQPESARRFAAGLTGKPVESFEVLPGEKVAKLPSGPGEREVAERLAGVDLSALRAGSLEARVAALGPLITSSEQVGRQFVAFGTGRVTLRGLGPQLEEIEETLDLGVGGSGRTKQTFLVVLEGGASDGGVIGVAPDPHEGEAS